MPLTKEELVGIKEKLEKPFQLKTIGEYKAGQYVRGSKIVEFNEYQMARILSILDKYSQKEDVPVGDKNDPQ
jgi:hypothetical protein